MKRQIRNSVFETNSSSTHSVVILNDEEYKKYKNGEIFISLYGDVRTKEEMDEEFEEEKKAAIERWENSKPTDYPRSYYETVEEYCESLCANTDFDEDEMIIEEAEREINGELVHAISLNSD